MFSLSPTEFDMPPSQCKHLRATIYSTDMIGYATCPDCGRSAPLYEVFNNLLDAMRSAIASVHYVNKGSEKAKGEKNAP